ncbi:MAG: helix-turn-helix domain-containing protein [Bacteroides sp.]
MENLDFLIRELCKLPQESEWFEFKTNNERPEMIGKTISALANGAVLVEKAYAYLSGELMIRRMKLLVLTFGFLLFIQGMKNLQTGYELCSLGMPIFSSIPSR